MNKNDLDELETHWRLGGLDDCHSLLMNGGLIDLIRLARLGLQSRKYDIENLKTIVRATHTCIVAYNEDSIAYIEALKRYTDQAMTVLEDLPEDKV